MITPNSSFTTTEKRIEVKDVISSFELTEIERAINLSNFSFYCPYPARQINSIYFDNYFYSSYEDSIEGSSLRTKKRIRWYGTEMEPINATLEIKKKHGIFSWKQLLKNKYVINPTANTWCKFIRDKDTTIVVSPLFKLCPISIISYYRQYYCSFDGTVRLTIDRNLKTYRQDRGINPNLSHPKDHFDLIIVEIKVDVSNSNLMREVCEHIPFNPRRFSKYCESLS